MNALPPAAPDCPESLCRRLLGLAHGPGQTPGMAAAAGDCSWESLALLCQEHELAGWLWAQRRLAPLASAPSGPAARLQTAYLSQVAVNSLALAQLDELAAAFAARGLRVAALKGLAALLWLYPDIGSRALGDLDLLIEPTALSEIHPLLLELGYTRQGAYCSPEDERARFHDSHLLPYWKPACLPLEIHGSLLAGAGDDGQAVREAWQRAVPVPRRGATVWRLAPEHFLLQAALHFLKHLRADGLGPLKDLADMSVVLGRRASDLDWQELWRTARRWGIVREAADVMATLRHYGGFQVRLLPPSARPLPADLLVRGLPRGCPSRDSLTPRGYLARLRMARNLPDARSRLRYWLGLVFPASANLRLRYRLPESRCLAPYYVWHPFAIAGRFLLGLAALARTGLNRRMRAIAGGVKPA